VGAYLGLSWAGPDNYIRSLIGITPLQNMSLLRTKHTRCIELNVVTH
jgi:hypothetical protein